MPVDMKFGHLPARRRVPPSAFLTVQEGCDKFCTYCVVPYTRGAEVSRGRGQIVDEAKALVAAGAREITLLGQNVNAWEDAGKGLHDLIAELDTISGLARIRYTTSHPNDMTQGLIDAHAHVEKLMPFLHLPVQSGSDRILKAMNRSHSRDIPISASLTAFAPRGPTSRCRAISSSASPARPKPISLKPCRWWRRSVTRRPIASNTARAPAPPPRRWAIKCPKT